MAEQGSASVITSAIRLVVGFLLVAVSATIFLAIALVLLPFRVLRIKLCNYYGKMIGYSITRLAGVTPVVRNRDRIDASFPAIYIANHTSTLDAFLSIWLCPVGGCGVMKRQAARIPFFGQLYLLSGHLLLDREDKGRAIAALDNVAALVRRHRLGIWIMPEGTRSKDGRLLPFKLGFVHLAIATGLPVVPVVFHGVHRNWALGSYRFRRMDVEIEVLEPVDTSAWRVETARQHAVDVHDRMARALGDDQKPLAAPSAVLPEKADPAILALEP